MNDTLSTPPTGADYCQLEWCDQPPDHDGNHVHLIGLVEPTPFINAVRAVLVTVECGGAEVDPLPVLSLVGDGAVTRLSARMSWPEARTLAGLLERAIEDHDPDAVVQRRGATNVAPVDVSTDYGHDAWQRALVRLGASGTIEMTGTAVIVEHDTMDETLRVHAPERTDVQRVREAVIAAATGLGVMR